MGFKNTNKVGKESASRKLSGLTTFEFDQSETSIGSSTKVVFDLFNTMGSTDWVNQVPSLGDAGKGYRFIGNYTNKNQGQTPSGPALRRNIVRYYYRSADGLTRVDVTDLQREETWGDGNNEANNDCYVYPHGLNFALPIKVIFNSNTYYFSDLRVTIVESSTCSGGGALEIFSANGIFQMEGI